MYLAKALTVSTSPSDPLYKPVNNFLIAKQYVDLTVIPDFLSLFHDSDMELIERRLWLLKIIRDGTKTITDLTVVFKTMCLKMILDIYTTVLSDKKTKVAILRALNSMVAIPRGFIILVEGYGFMSWLNCVVRNINGDKTIVKELIDLSKTMIYSLGLSVISKNCSKHIFNGNSDGLAEFRMKNDLEYEISSIIYNVLPHTNEMDIEEFLTYIEIFNLITKRSIKFMTKKQVLNILACCMERCKNSDCVKVVQQAVNLNNPLILKSKSIYNVVTSESRLIEELSSFVQKYVA